MRQFSLNKRKMGMPHNSTNKPIFFYTKIHTTLQIHRSAVLTVLAHPNSFSNLIKTSAVKSYNDITGEFETQNSIYKPYKETA